MILIISEFSGQYLKPIVKLPFFSNSDLNSNPNLHSNPNLFPVLLIQSPNQPSHIQSPSPPRSPDTAAASQPTNLHNPPNPSKSSAFLLFRGRSCLEVIYRGKDCDNIPSSRSQTQFTILTCMSVSPSGGQRSGGGMKKRVM